MADAKIAARMTSNCIIELPNSQTSASLQGVLILFLVKHDADNVLVFGRVLKKSVISTVRSRISYKTHSLAQILINYAVFKTEEGTLMQK